MILGDCVGILHDSKFYLAMLQPVSTNGLDSYLVFGLYIYRYRY